MSLLALVVEPLLFVGLSCYGFLFMLGGLRSYIHQSGLIALSSALAFITLGQNGILSPQKIFEFSAALHVTSFADFLIRALSNSLFGVIAGAPFAIALEASPLVGRLIDTARGAQFGEQINPLFGEHTSLLEAAGALLSWVVILQTGLYREPLRVFFLASAELARTPDVYAFSFDSLATMAKPLILLLSKVFSVALLLVCPIIILGLLIDLLNGVLGRMVVRVGLSGELVSLRLVVCLYLGVSLATMLIPASSSLVGIFSQASTILSQRLGRNGG